MFSQLLTLSENSGAVLQMMKWEERGHGQLYDTILASPWRNRQKSHKGIRQDSWLLGPDWNLLCLKCETKDASHLQRIF
jgi:hypothetical protein